MHVSNALLNGKQSFMEGCGPLEGTHRENHRRTRLQVGDRSSIADLGTLDAEFVGVTVDALAGGALVGESVGKRAVAIHWDTWNASEFPVDIRDAAFACGEVRMLAGLVGVFGKEQRAWEALSTKAVGVMELQGRMQRQANGAERSAISETINGRCGGLSERNSGNAPVTGSRFGDRPCVRGGISREMGGKVVESKDGLARKRTERRDIVRRERLRVFGEHNGSLCGSNGGGDTGSRAPDAFFLFCCRAIGWFLVGATLHAQRAIGIALWLTGVVGAICDGGALMVFVHPGGEVRDIKGNGFAQTRNLFLERAHRRGQEGIQERAVAGAQCLAEPGLARQGVFDITAGGLAGITHEAKAQCENQQGMASQQAAQVCGGKHAFADAHEKSVEGGGFWMRRAPASRTLGLPWFHDRPIEEGEEGPRVQNEWVMITQGSDGGLVKEGRCRYQSTGLLLVR